MSDTNTLKVPAGALVDVRDGLSLEIGKALDELGHLLDHPDREQHEDWFEEDRRRLEAAFALVDRVGWGPGESEDEVTIDLPGQGRLLKRVIEAQMPSLRDLLAEVDLSDAWRAQRGVPPRRQELEERERVVTRFLADLERTLRDAGL